MIKPKTGRKPKPEGEKIRQKKVYISDDTEQVILKRHKVKDLTALVTHPGLTTKPTTNKKK